MAPGGERPRGNLTRDAVVLQCLSCSGELDPLIDWPEKCPACGAAKGFKKVREVTVEQLGAPSSGWLRRFGRSRDPQL